MLNLLLPRDMKQLSKDARRRSTGEESKTRLGKKRRKQLT
jgi:hypothetical protein